MKPMSALLAFADLFVEGVPGCAQLDGQLSGPVTPQMWREAFTMLQLGEEEALDFVYAATHGDVPKLPALLSGSVPLALPVLRRIVAAGAVEVEFHSLGLAFPHVAPEDERALRVELKSPEFGRVALALCAAQLRRQQKPQGFSVPCMDVAQIEFKTCFVERMDAQKERRQDQMGVYVRPVGGLFKEKYGRMAKALEEQLRFVVRRVWRLTPKIETRVRFQGVGWQPLEVATLGLSKTVVSRLTRHHGFTSRNDRLFSSQCVFVLFCSAPLRKRLAVRLARTLAEWNVPTVEDMRADELDFESALMPAWRRPFDLTGECREEHVSCGNTVLCPDVVVHDSEIVAQLKRMSLEAKGAIKRVSLRNNLLVLPCHEPDLNILLSELPALRLLDLTNTDLRGAAFGAWLSDALRTRQELLVRLSAISVTLQATWYSQMEPWIQQRILVVHDE